MAIDTSNTDNNTDLNRAVSSFVEACKRILYEFARERESSEAIGQEKDKVISKEH